MLITPSFFVGEISIPNIGTGDVDEKVNLFIEQYEPVCLQGILGYELYKAFIADPSEERMQNLINGSEYYFSGRLVKWKGLVYTNNGFPAQPYILGYSQRPDESIQVDVTSGLVSGTNTFTFDGTLGKPDYRGYKLIVTRVGYDTMIENYDYSFNKTTGTFTLLKDGDVFAADSFFHIMFNPSPIVWYQGPTGTNYFSLIANYIYYFIKHEDSVWNSGVGTVVPKGSQFYIANPKIKMNWAYNNFARQGKELCYFLYNQSSVYPEWGSNVQNNALRFCRTINDFDI